MCTKFTPALVKLAILYRNRWVSNRCKIFTLYLSESASYIIHRGDTLILLKGSNNVLPKGIRFELRLTSKYMTLAGEILKAVWV